MPTAIVVGGSVAGLAGALALHTAGYEVLILERSAPPPEGPVASAAAGWHRPAVPQAQQSHTLTSLGVRVLRERAPEVMAALLAAGAELFDLTRSLPPGVSDRAREEGDDDLVSLGSRRTTFELVLHRYVRALPRVSWRYRTAVRGLLLDADRRAVRGVLGEGGGHSGEKIAGDIVVDATGRRALSRTWLREAGVRLDEDRTEPSGLAGFARFYRLTRHGPYNGTSASDRPGPLNRGHAAGGVWDHYAGVLHPGDAGTFSIALGVLPGDRELGRLREPAAFTAVARATPGLAPWLADGVSDPISPVHALTSPPNTLRAAATEAPVAGLFPLGDGACVTNPLFGLGMSLALEHAFRLADLLAARPVVDDAQARAAAQLAEEIHRPWYELSAAADRERIARWRSALPGAPADGHADRSGGTSAGGPTLREITAAAATDGVVWRGLMRVLMGLDTPKAVLGDEKFVLRVARSGTAGESTVGDRPDSVPPPGRSELLRAVAAMERT